MHKEKTKPKLKINMVKHTDEVFKYEQWNYSADDKTIRIVGSDDKIHNTPVETWYVDPTASAEEFQLICDQLNDMRMAQNTPPHTMH